jgi:hypothetical protein
MPIAAGSKPAVKRRSGCSTRVEQTGGVVVAHASSATWSGTPSRRVSARRMAAPSPRVAPNGCRPFRDAGAGRAGQPSPPRPSSRPRGGRSGSPPACGVCGAIWPGAIERSGRPLRPAGPLRSGNAGRLSRGAPSGLGVSPSRGDPSAAPPARKRGSSLPARVFLLRRQRRHRVFTTLLPNRNHFVAPRRRRGRRRPGAPRHGRQPGQLPVRDALASQRVRGVTRWRSAGVNLVTA